MTMATPRYRMHQHYLQVLARRAAAQDGAVRELLEARLRAASVVKAPAASEEPAPAVPAKAPANATSLLAALNQHIRERQQAQGNGPELRSSRRFRQSWSRLAAADRVDRALTRGPDNAGPLNAHGLVVRSLALMRELSPDYLQQFLAQADALLWLEQEVHAAAAAAKPAKRPRTRTN